MKHSKSILFIMTLLLVIGVFTPSVYAADLTDNFKDPSLLKQYVRDTLHAEGVIENTSFFNFDSYNYYTYIYETGISGNSYVVRVLTVRVGITSDSFKYDSNDLVGSYLRNINLNYDITTGELSSIDVGTSWSSGSGNPGLFGDDYDVIKYHNNGFIYYKRYNNPNFIGMYSEDIYNGSLYSTLPVYSNDNVLLMEPIPYDYVYSPPVEEGEYPFDYADVRILTPNSTSKPFSSFNLPFKFEMIFRNITEDFVMSDYQAAIFIDDWRYDINTPPTEETDEHGYFYFTGTDIYTLDNHIGGEDFVVFAEGYLNHYLLSNLLRPEGSHDFKVKIYKRIEGEISEYITDGSVNFELVRGFVDADQDGKDDRTGETYQEHQAGQNDPDYGPPIIDIGLDLSDFSIKDMSGFLEESLSALKGIFVNVWGIVPPELLSVILVAVVMYMILRVLGR